MNIHYTIIIQWSEEDKCFVVSLPEWGEFCQTHGDTYQEALQNAQEVLELLIESSLAEGKPLPEPQTLGKSLKSAYSSPISALVKISHNKETAPKSNRVSDFLSVF
ncbi:MAG: type II toxin-antitoxin system HicB family antitoxin [Microcoleaceae cyanobacterium]